MKNLAVYQEIGAADLDKVVLEHLPLVRRVAGHLASRVPDTVSFDDLMQAGVLGLLDAVKRFETGHGASFETYAELRIRGSILDELRRGDWSPRSLYRRARSVAEAIRAVEAKLGRSARDGEVAAELGLPLDGYHDTLRQLAGQRLLSVDELMDNAECTGMELPGDTPGPEQLVAEDEASARLQAVLEESPEREQLVLSLYYHEGLNLKEIGSILELSESRVSQIRTQALLRLRARLKNDEDE